MKNKLNLTQLSCLFFLCALVSCNILQDIFNSDQSSSGTPPLGIHITQNPVTPFEDLPESCKFTPLDNFNWNAGSSGSGIAINLNNKLQDNSCNLNATSPCVPPPPPSGTASNVSINYSSQTKCESLSEICKLWYLNDNNDDISLNGDDMNTILNNALANAYDANRPYCSCQSMNAHIKLQEIFAQKVGDSRAIYVKTTYECCGQCR